MRVLIISGETWRDDSNGGNVLSNIFSGTSYSFAQIYCNPTEPYNKLCKDYFQITDRDAVNYLLKRDCRKEKAVGREIHYDAFPDNPGKWSSGNGTSAFYRIVKKFRFESFYVFQEILWKMVPLENDRLEKFIKDFAPDIIFAPCYASHRMLRLTRYAAKLTGKPVISYISDDNYSLKQLRLSPVYWINRLVLRRHMRKTIPLYSLLYTMTDEQKAELEKEFDIPIKILRKHADFTAEAPKKNRDKKQIRLIYAGGIYLNRWKTLSKISEAIKKLNCGSETKFRLDIYTQNELSEKQRKILDNKESSFLHAAVPFDKLTDIYNESDIALHCESFDARYRYSTRMSFSTKIIDCLHSGCAVMAIAWKEHSGLIYLKREEAAFCIEDTEQIEPTLRKIQKNPDLIDEYAIRAWECGKRNHNTCDVRKMLQDDFEKISGTV